MPVNQVQAYPKGTSLFAAGDSAQAVYFILSGSVVASQGGEKVSLGPGGILGDVAFFTDSTHSYEAVCVTDVTALKVTQDTMVKVFTSQPRIAGALLRELAGKVESSKWFHFIQGVEEPAEPEPEPEPAPRKVYVAKGILPEGHPIYEQRMAPEHSDFLFSSEGQCPVCQTKFTGLKTRSSRLQLENQRPDFRTIYRNFEPNYYYLWVCPSCLFTYPERQYSTLSPLTLRRAKNVWTNKPAAEPFQFDQLRTVHQVLCSYYLAIATFEAIGATPDQWANLWLRLLWIYEDLEDQPRALQAAEKARSYFTAAMAQTARSAAGDQQVYIILGELNLRLGNKAEAFKSFHAAALIAGGDPRHKRVASDRIQDLRDQRKEGNA